MKRQLDTAYSGGNGLLSRVFLVVETDGDFETIDAAIERAFSNNPLAGYHVVSATVTKWRDDGRYAERMLFVLESGR